MNHPDFEGFDDAEKEAQRILNGAYEDIDAITVEMDLQEQLIRRYKQALFILEDASKEPVGQRASMLRVTVEIIKDIARTKTAVYNAERLIVLENTLIAVLQDFPQLRDEFLKRYEEGIKANGLV